MLIENVNRDKERNKGGGGGRAYEFESLQTLFYDARSHNEERKVVNNEN